MNRLMALLAVSVIALAACQSEPAKEPAAAPPPAPAPATATDAAAPIAGRTLSCDTGGPASALTFGADGAISGRLLQTDVTGTWHMIADGAVHAHVVAGPVSLRDDLSRDGRGWSGRTLKCRAD